MEPDWEAVRAEFPALARWTFLNTATFGQLPRRCNDAVARHFVHRNAQACWNFLDWFDDADAVRASIARLIQCQAEDIAFITNAASALSLLMSGLPWNAGDRVVTLAGEFPNNLYNPAVLARRGVECAEVPWEAFHEAVTARARLVILSTVNYTTGFRPPLAETAAFLRERGVLFYVDGTQSLGALEFSVPAVQPDMLAVDAYKWLLGPTGSGFVYVRPDLRRVLEPAVIGWRSHKDWRNVGSLHHGAPEFSEAAERYEGGMLNFPSIYGLGASVEMMLEIGPARIERRVMELADRARATLRGLGGEVTGDGLLHFDSPVVAARFAGADATRLAARLKARRVQVSARHGLLRVSTHFYNCEEDLEVLGWELGGLLSG